MTLTCTWYVDCDRCGGVDQPGQLCCTEAAARVDLYGRGWRFRDGVCLCPECADANPAEETSAEGAGR